MRYSPAMADTTSHDTVGASTLAAPYFSPSSPEPSEHPPVDSPDRLPSPVSSQGARSPSNSPPAFRDASLDRAARELDARLAEYTVDFSQFPTGHAPDDAIDELPEIDEEADRLSAVGGPEDFTANLERYLLGEDDSIDQEVDDQDEDQEQPGQEFDSEPKLPQLEDHKLERQADDQLRQPEVEDEAELGEYSEFEPPVDMSTPSHLLRRMPTSTRDVTHLEDIEEDPDDEPSMTATPSVRKAKSPINKDEKHTDEALRQHIAELTQAIKDRDEQLEKTRKHVLEATSAGEEIRHLRGELQRRTALLEELQERGAHGSVPRRSSINASDFSALQKQITDMQKDMQSRNSNADIDAERLETIAILRQQLSLTQEQLRKRDAVLDETLAKLKEVTAAKELQLHEKNADIDRLRSQIGNQRLELQKLEMNLSRSHREYRLLEDQMVLLETKNRPLEEKNSTLEADLTRAQSQVTAQENALKAMAADLPVDPAAGGTYSEILELIKDLGEPTASRPAKPRDTGDRELEQIHEELAKLRAESSETASTNKSLEAQLSRAHDQAAESQLIIQSIEVENTRLTQRAEELKSTLDQTHGELNRARTEHSEALETIERLQDDQPPHQEQNQTQQPSPPPTPHSTIEATHNAQLASLKTAHATSISTLRTAHANSTRKLRALLSASEKREADLRAELDQSNPQPHPEQENKDAEISSLRAETKRLHSVITAKDETASAMDLRIAKSVEKREREWERRVELLLKERERMSKALLWSWGEKEVPQDDDKENTIVDEDGKRRQGYRYKYARKT
ncbi:hypothetical protein BDW59DRAFT_68213 [Aspergillus cavernicola]|uniref:Spindle pole body associated protein SnaD n=1 Tax=Aspergillus cavernicola TaxID=176166 RepID=A0ABR4IDU2_9EURO